MSDKWHEGPNFSQKHKKVKTAAVFQRAFFSKLKYGEFIMEIIKCVEFFFFNSVACWGGCFKNKNISDNFSEKWIWNQTYSREDRKQLPYGFSRWWGEAWYGEAFFFHSRFSRFSTFFIVGVNLLNTARRSVSLSTVSELFSLCVFDGYRRTDSLWKRNIQGF